MKHYCNPMNLEYRYQFCKRAKQGETSEVFKVYREAADPSLILFKNTYFLFPSMTAGFFTSDDLHDWKFYEFKGEMPVYDYAPDVCVIGHYMYFSASRMGEIGHFYRTRDPRTEAFEKIDAAFSFQDPNLFADDDGRVYFYWGCSNKDPIFGVELDPKTMEPLTEKKAMFGSAPSERGYERVGNNHIPLKSQEQIEETIDQMLPTMLAQLQRDGLGAGMPEEEIREMLKGYLSNRPYMEGAWMTKHNSKYYLQYATPGTEYNIYGDGVYVGEHPLGPFQPGNNNPYSYNPGGFITGAGHGSTLEDKKGAFWHVSSMRISHNEAFERRLGLWKAGFDEDGELYCDQRFACWPVALDAKPFDKPDWMLLSYNKKVKVSSGVGAENITDENVQTFWKAGTNKPGEYAVVDLGNVKDVAAVQINFADDGIERELPEGVEPMRMPYEERWIDMKRQKTNWLLEGSEDGEAYTVIADKRTSNTDYAHDFIEFEKMLKLRYIRLTVERVPYDQPAAISGIRVFGKGTEAMPEKAHDIKINFNGKMDFTISWKAKGCVGATILWGYQCDKLYHSYMVYGEKRCNVGALIVGMPLYVRVDTFNEAGITEGDVISV